MSYILDALRKAEKDRQRGSTPDIMTVQDAAAEMPTKRRLSAYLLIAALLLNAGIFTWLLKPWQEKEINVVPPLPVSQQQAVTAEKVQRPSAAIKETPAIPDSSRKSSSGEKISVQSKPAPKAEIVKTPPAPAHVKVAGQEREVIKQAPAESQPPAQSKSVPDGRVYTLKDLPEPVRQALPKMTVSLHYYEGDPALRMVSINNRTVREGEEFAAGLRLEEIAADGAVITFQGYRIHLGLPK